VNGSRHQRSGASIIGELRAGTLSDARVGHHINRIMAAAQLPDPAGLKQDVRGKWVRIVNR